jgi:hypothetical protein
MFTEDKMPNSGKNSLWLGYDVEVSAGAIHQPQKIVVWKEHQFKNTQPEKPLHYKADALVGLALVHLNQHLKNPFSTPQMNFSFANESWLSFEPHHELFNRSQPRVSSLRSHMKESSSAAVENFEKMFTEILDTAIQPSGVDLQELTELITSIEFLEAKMGRPLLYHFAMKLNRTTVEKLHYLHSLLFNLRSLIAMDYNAYVQDPTHECIKVDSISDYINKAEYVANDAMLYWNFKKMKEQLPDLAQKKLEENFKTYSHNGFCLIESLPKSFLNSMSVEQLEESLYIAQMDWLLGTDAGLLFRCREELYGIAEGYDKVFWPELSDRPVQSSHTLSVNCLITETDVFPTLEVA